MSFSFKSVSVFCGASNGYQPIYQTAAIAMGRLFAQHDLTLVYGGGKVGLMGTIADAVLEAGGKVVGVIPTFMQTAEVAHPNLTEMIVTESMHQRKMTMHERSDAVIIMAGGYGTMDEFFEMLTWGQLGLHTKPMGILNTNNYYSGLLDTILMMNREGFLRKTYQDMVLVDENPALLLNKMNQYVPPTQTRLIDTTAT